ncbi:hypothetical protein OS493_039770 [Desmophyllum pertusum]|uniref:Uncharacterized protein n=1 Tax=Desmophyllum pertusum TaxID=174260 RepID=A0A9X0CIN8_9CNID|nr:hypothetical protein OS493_039770 [Desmophyllum pertusum]
MKNQADALEVMTKRLDREMKAVKNWRHFSSQLKVDVNVIERLKWYGDFSPTIRVFEHLEIVKPDLTIFQVKTGLFEIGRKDMSNLLDEDDLHLDGNTLVKYVITPESDLLRKISTGLNRQSWGNWELAQAGV